MSESLKIIAVGKSRERALKVADAQAVAYFGATGFLREIGQAEVISQTYGGRNEGFQVSVEYFPKP